VNLATVANWPGMQNEAMKCSARTLPYSRKIKCILIALLMLSCMAKEAAGQMRSNRSTVLLMATMPESFKTSEALTLSLGSASTTGSQGSNKDATISISMSWAAGSERAYSDLGANFHYATAALSKGSATDNPSGRIAMTYLGAGSEQSEALSKTVAPGHAGYGVTTFGPDLSTRYKSGQAGTVTFRVNVGGLKLTKDEYVGTFTLQAQAL
jgi:hypothetical protein